MFAFAAETESQEADRGVEVESTVSDEVADDPGSIGGGDESKRPPPGQSGAGAYNPSASLVVIDV